MLAVEVKKEAKVTPPNSSSPKDPGPRPFATGIGEGVSPYAVLWRDLRDLDSYNRPSTKGWEGNVGRKGDYTEAYLIKGEWRGHANVGPHELTPPLQFIQLTWPQGLVGP